MKDRSPRNGAEKRKASDNKASHPQEPRQIPQEYLRRQILVLELCRGTTAFAFIGISWLALEAQFSDSTLIDRAIQDGLHIPGSLPQIFERLRLMGFSDQWIINSMYGLSAGALFVTEKFGSLLGELKHSIRKQR